MSAPEQKLTPEPAANAVSSRVWFWVFLLAVPIQLNAEHIERGGRWHHALPKLLDAPGAGVSAMGGKVCATPTQLCECRGKAGAVVHHTPAIREDDRDAVMAGLVIAGDSHGSSGGGCEAVDLAARVEYDDMTMGFVGQLGSPLKIGSADSMIGIAMTAVCIREKRLGSDSGVRVHQVIVTLDDLGIQVALNDGQWCIHRAAGNRGGLGACLEVTANHPAVNLADADRARRAEDRMIQGNAGSGPEVGGVTLDFNHMSLADNGQSLVGRGAGKIGSCDKVEGLFCDLSVAGEVIGDVSSWGGLHLFRLVGVGRCVVQLRGLYTFSVYPQEKSTLFLCRPKTADFCPQNATAQAPQPEFLKL